MEEFTTKELKIAGAILYSCEDTKPRRDKRRKGNNVFYWAIEFTNSNPILVALFLRFLREVIIIDKKLYSDYNTVRKKEKEIKKFSRKKKLELAGKMRDRSLVCT